MFVARMCKKFSDDDIPHNVAFIRGKPLRYNASSLTTNDDYIVRLYVWPRRPTLGIRVGICLGELGCIKGCLEL